MGCKELHLLSMGVLAMALTAAAAQNKTVPDEWELEYETTQEQWEFEPQEDYEDYGYQDYGYDDYGYGDYYDDYEADPLYNQRELEREEEELLIEDGYGSDLSGDYVDSSWNSYGSSDEHYYTEDWYETEDAFSGWYDEQRVGSP